jgi:hypothetical protein
VPGGGFTERVWHCPKCNREVGRGLTPPALVSCCGIDYVNGKPRGRSGIQLPFLGGSGNSGSNANTPASNPFVPDDSGSSSSGTGKLIAVGVVVVVFGIAILGGVIFLVVQSGKGAGPVRRRRPRSDDRIRDRDRDRGRDREGRYERERY